MIHIMKVIVMSIRGIILVTVANNIVDFGGSGMYISFTQYSGWSCTCQSLCPITFEEKEINAIQSVAKMVFILVKNFFIN